MNNLIHQILIKARQSLEAAEILANQDFFDFAASRAYYAMFYTAEALLLSKSLSFSSHSAVIANYGKEFSKSKEMDPVFHKQLIAVQDLRSQGDYSFSNGVSEISVEQALEWAADFLQAATVYLEEK